MTSRRLSYLGVASVLALGANGCASVQPPARMVEVRPARTPAEPPASAADNLYRMAVAAVDRRDYARALDLLQAARDRTPQDARVLNAFGVVYDKLGRFDLSGRYYAQAQAADPGSAIVAENQAYSNLLQGKAPLPALAAQDVAPVTIPPAPAQSTGVATAASASAAQVALAQVSKPAAMPAAPVPAPLVLASAQAAPVRPTPAPSEVEHAAAAVPATRVALAALATREPPPAAPAPLQRAPLAVGLAIAPTSPASRLPATPLQVASIPGQPSLKIQPTSLQARAQLAAMPVAPTPPAAAISPPASAAKPLVIPPVQAEKRSPLPPITQVAANGAGPAMVVAPPARAPARLTALPLLQSAGPAAVLRRVSLPVFQMASSLAPPAYGTANRPPEDRPAPAARQAAASVPARSAGLTRAVATIAPTPAPRRATGSGFIGRALVIIDASGNRRVADALRLQLARRGWSVPGARLPSLARRGQTTIRYAAAHAAVARALANSLRIPVKLERCARPCRGVSLILGADSRAPTGGQRSISGLRRLS
jgi:LytR cell envelope-related transcriptional attenuator